MKKRLLFVDDEINILEGLGRVLRNQRNAWEIHFASSGAEALRIMEAQPIDVIIADISMPLMDGIRLLEKVIERHPGTIRMVLSGRSESDLITKSAAIAHQYLSKPCDPEILKSVIAQTDESNLFLQNEKLKTLVAELGALPSPPLLLHEIAGELNSPDASINKIGEIISRDPSMAAKVLQVSNSALYGRRRTLSNISEAVSYLGMDRVAQLLLAIHAFSQFTLSEEASFSIEGLWTHSNSTAVLAKKIAQEHNASGKIVDDAFAAGLLHDIGKLILASRLPELYSKATMRATAAHVPMWFAEREAFSTTHAEIGAYLLSIWGLPDSIVNATAFHHNPSAKKRNGFSPLNAVHAADILEHLADGGSAS